MKNHARALTLLFALGLLAAGPACSGPDVSLPPAEPPAPVPTTGAPAEPQALDVAFARLLVPPASPPPVRSSTGVLLVGAVLSARTAAPSPVSRLSLSYADGRVRVQPGDVDLPLPCRADRPAWTPGGDAVVCNTGSGLVSQRLGAASGAQRLTSAALDRDAALSPDGRAVAFSRPHPTTGQREIYLLPGEQPLTAAGPNTQPAFSPDGASLAYVHLARGGAQELHLLDLRTRVVTRLTSAEVDSAPTFAPDGRQLAFVRQGPKGAQVRVVALDAATDSRLVADGAAAPLYTAAGQLGYLRPGVGYMIGDRAIAAPDAAGVQGGPGVPPLLLVGAGSLLPGGAGALVAAGGPAPAPGALVLVEGQPRLRLLYDAAPYAVVAVDGATALTCQALGPTPPPRTRLPGARQALGAAYLILRGPALQAVVTQGGADAATAGVEGGALVLRGAFNGVYDDAGGLAKAGPLRELKIDLKSGAF